MNAIVLTLLIISPFTLHKVKCAQVIQRLNLKDSINEEETTTEILMKEEIANAWEGRKIGADHIINDIMDEEIKTENEIPDITREKSKNNSHPCMRTCLEGEPVKICHYIFHVEWYQTMSKACFDCPYNKTDCERPHCVPGDGVKRPVLLVNRQMPGPAVEVCLNDIVVVQIENSLMEESTSVHWHGQHQRSSPYMDGVPYVTQCSIQPKTTFTYRFKAETPGTHFWHSHSALQRGDGMFGALIVRVPPAQDPHLEFFDFDLSQHMMVILDWTHAPGITKFVAHHHSDGDNKPEAILVNGKGRYVEFEDDQGKIHNTPMERFDVKQGFRYRFRIINAGFLNCPIQMSIDNHTMVVIASDGSDLEPVEADSLVTYAGERFDIIVQMDQEPDNYWIRYRGLMDCDERFTSAYQLAVLHYEGVPKNKEPEGDTPTYENSLREGLEVNSLNSGFQWNGSLSVPELKAMASQTDQTLKPVADHKFFLSYDFYALDNPFMHRERLYGFNDVKERVFTPQLNHISMKFPPFPLMVDLEAGKQHKFCNSSTIPENCKKEFCECTHLLRVPLGAVAEIILVDKGFTYDANHPFHLHGHAFRVIGMDRLGKNVTIEEVKRLDEEGKLKRNFDHPPIKDTVTVPDGGYTILRWHATNPGYWLFHCHIEYHVELGMAVVFKVGEDKDFPPKPHHFPTCNNFYHDERTTTQRPTTERSFNYTNHRPPDLISEIEFAIDNTIGFLTTKSNKAIHLQSFSIMTIALHMITVLIFFKLLTFT